MFEFLALLEGQVGPKFQPSDCYFKVKFRNLVVVHLNYNRNATMLDCRTVFLQA